MTADVIWQLQKAVYSALTGNAAITTAVNGIYEYVPQDSVFPYLVIDEMAAQNWSTLDTKGAEIHFIVKAFARDKENRRALDIITKVNDLLNNNNLTLQNHNLISLQYKNMKVDRMNDGITYMVATIFNALTVEV